MTVSLGIRAIVCVAGLLTYGLGQGKVANVGFGFFVAAATAILFTLKF